MKIGDHNKIISDRNIFNQIVYTPLSEALKLLDERRKDSKLMAKVEKILKGDIPNILKDRKCAILFRQVATPNYETRRFLALSKENELHPVIFEYHNDKFTSNNEFKHSLGQLHIERKNSKNGDYNVEKITVIDFNLHNGKKFKEIKTLWGEPLIDFHRKLFSVHDYKHEDFELYNASEWFEKNGGKALNYYTNLLTMFTCYGILFENFLVSKDAEGDFTKNVVLPAIENTMNSAGMRPLIVPLEPIDIETDKYWISYHQKIKPLLKVI